MPTSELLSDFRRDYAKLTEAQRKAFRLAVKKFVIDLRRGGPFRGSLRVKPMQDKPNNFEMTWEGQGGRAPFDHGPAQRPGDKHIRWRRIGGHEIFGNLLARCGRSAPTPAGPLPTQR